MQHVPLRTSTAYIVQVCGVGKLTDNFLYIKYTGILRYREEKSFHLAGFSNNRPYYTVLHSATGIAFFFCPEGKRGKEEEEEAIVEKEESCQRDIPAPNDVKWRRRTMDR